MYYYTSYHYRYISSLPSSTYGHIPCHSWQVLPGVCVCGPKTLFHFFDLMYENFFPCTSCLKIIITFSLKFVNIQFLPALLVKEGLTTKWNHSFTTEILYAYAKTWEKINNIQASKALRNPRGSWEKNYYPAIFSVALFLAKYAIS
jgi:hypothetical protein